MLRKVLVTNEGGTDLLPGSHVSRSDLNDIMLECIQKGVNTPVVKPLLLHFNERINDKTAAYRPCPHLSFS